MASNSSRSPPAGPPPSRNYLDRARGAGESSSDAASAAPQQLVRSYLVWPARNTFCCWGHCMTGPTEDLWPNTCAWFTILIPMILFLYTWAGTLMRVSQSLLWLVLVTFGSTIFWFMATAFTDPGVIPRSTEPVAKPAPPLYRERIDDDGAIVTDTWCHTCRVYRPPRASHCSDCDNCVRDFDHHCPFTRNCIGSRNYSFFIAFLVSVSASLGLLLACCLMLAGIPRPAADVEDPNATAGGSSVDPGSLEALGLGPLINSVLVVFAVVLSLPLWTFTGYHVALVVSGFTTKEHLKGRKNGAKRLLCSRISCCTVTPSLLEPRKLVPLGSGRRDNYPPIVSHAML